MSESKKIILLSEILEVIFNIKELSIEVLKVQKKRKYKNKESQCYLKKWYAFNLGNYFRKINWHLKRYKHVLDLVSKPINPEMSFLEITEEIVNETQSLILENISINKIENYLADLRTYISVLADFDY